MSFTVQDGVNLHAQVQTLVTQINTLTTQNETITQQYDLFKTQATAEINALKAQQTSAPGQGGTSSALRLGDLKDFKPDAFSGKRDQDYKPWRKRFVTYLNMACPGFRQALVWSEKYQGEIGGHALTQMGWEKAVEANTKLWDFLTLTCTDDALVVVESAKEQGF